jgi:hypothetical protein
MPRPFSRNSTVIDTSFNISAIMDRVTEKLSKLNILNQSINQSMNQSMNQSGIAPTITSETNSSTFNICPSFPKCSASIIKF